jgi:hypothetical protein
VHEKPDLILASSCFASLIFVPLFVIGVTVVLFSIAVAGEIAGRSWPRSRLDRHPHDRDWNVHGR